jgi:uncharacterized protein
MSVKTLRNDFDDFRWISPPPSSSRREKNLVFTTGENTDYWQRTSFEFQRDDAHLFALAVQGDFDASCTVKIAANSRYDQAGIALRKDANTWLKASIEDNGTQPPLLGCVVTNHGYSDWSMQVYSGEIVFVTYQIKRRGADVTVFARREDQAEAEMLRLAHLHEVEADTELFVGAYACSPEGPGCEVIVSEFTLRGV